MKIRGFEVVSKYKNSEIAIPRRSTLNAAGYDIEASETFTLEAGEIRLVPTGLKAYMLPDEVLHLHDRSSNPRKKGVVLANSVGVVDADYYNNPDNEGELFAQFKNITEHQVVIEKGERIMQGVFMKYLLADNDDEVAKSARAGGFGSTGQ